MSDSTEIRDAKNLLFIKEHEVLFANLEITRLKAEVERWEFIHRMDTLAIQKQKEQNERLRKAGDAMAEHIKNDEVVCYSIFDKDEVIDAWNAAKDGEPTE